MWEIHGDGYGIYSFKHKNYTNQCFTPLLTPSNLFFWCGCNDQRSCSAPGQGEGEEVGGEGFAVPFGVGAAGGVDPEEGLREVNWIETCLRNPVSWLGLGRGVWRAPGEIYSPQCCKFSICLRFGLKYTILCFFQSQIYCKLIFRALIFAHIFGM